MISGFTKIEGRYVLMLKNTYKKGVGIVHGSSNTTGRSLYVEPLEIVIIAGSATCRRGVDPV